MFGAHESHHWIAGTLPGNDEAGGPSRLCVIPAKAGVQSFLSARPRTSWIPAFAGMKKERGRAGGRRPKAWAL